uniref:Uncharacterized protein n=1 Tax=Oryza rufipogon TaxID=4529 RepID=A0A0E0RJB9_ORYRU
MVAAPSSAWQDLPTDLLVLVLLRFPSLTDRARLRTCIIHDDPKQPVMTDHQYVLSPMAPKVFEAWSCGAVSDLVLPG